MTTTVMKNSQVGDQWIQDMSRLNPVQRVVDDKGNVTDSILSGPVRLAFTDSLFTAKPQMKKDPTSKLKHSVTMLFTPYTVFDLYWEDYYKVAASDFASHYNPEARQYYGLDNPIYDQGTKMKYPGFTPGLMAMNVSSNFKPHIVDPQGNLIVDERRVYPGVWAIVATNRYASGKQAPRKGPRFGLQTIMIIGDDAVLASGAPDPKMQFRTAQVRPPVNVTGAAFAQHLPPQPGGAPAGAPGAAYYPPHGHTPAGAPMAPPVIPQIGGAFPPPMPSMPPQDDEDVSSLM